MAKDASNAAHSSEKNPFLFSSGDVTLLKTHPKTKQSLSGTVLSHALTLASPVWKKFLFPPWEANDAEPKPKQIDCREDDSSALLLLLSIAHLQFNEVPKGQLEYSLLFEVAKLCDQYDCVDLVRPWLRDWLAGEEIECLKVGKEGWLWISWVFGREKAFEACAKNLAKLVSTDKNGGCFLENGKPIPEPVPAGIVESILNVRQAIIAKMLRVPYDLAEIYCNCLFSNSDKCNGGGSSAACNDIIYGAILRSLQQARLWPIKSAQSILISPKALAEKLGKLDIQPVPIPGHRHCAPRINGRLWGVENSVENPVLETHRTHMNIQNRDEK